MLLLARLPATCVMAIPRTPLFAAASAPGTLKQQVAAYEQELVLHAVEREGSIRRAAKALGVDHSTLVKKFRQYGLAESVGGE